MKLKDKVVFLTGGGEGMGRATLVEAAKEGAKVAFIDLSDENAKRTAELLTEMGADFFYSLTDVTDEGAVVAAITETENKFGPIDVLVNNVGYDLEAPIHEATPEQWDKTLNLNLKSIYVTSKNVLPAMMERQSGVIINISSTAGTNPQKATPVYSAAKAGVIMLTKTMALYYADYGIRVNSVAPGLTKTAMLSQVSDEYLQQLEAVVPLQRMGQPSDIAKTVVFLSSDDAGYVTGQVWGVDGGLPLI